MPLAIRVDNERRRAGSSKLNGTLGDYQLESKSKLSSALTDQTEILDAAPNVLGFLFPFERKDQALKHPRTYVHRREARMSGRQSMESRDVRIRSL